MHNHSEPVLRLVGIFIFYGKYLVPQSIDAFANSCKPPRFCVSVHKTLSEQGLDPLDLRPQEIFRSVHHYEVVASNINSLQLLVGVTVTFGEAIRPLA
jgi:hypothetical protein